MRQQIATKLLQFSRSLGHTSSNPPLDRGRLTILLFVHGYSLAHTLRPLVVAQALRKRGYQVVLAGEGPHLERLRQEGFTVHEVATLPQKRMDVWVNRGDYGYYDWAWTDRCVRAERQLIRQIKPQLVIYDMKPTAEISTKLEGVDAARITQGYNQPGYKYHIPVIGSLEAAIGPFDEYLAAHAGEVKPQRKLSFLADMPQFHPPGREASGHLYVGPLLDRPPEKQPLPEIDEGWDQTWPLIYLTCGSSGRDPEYLQPLIEALADKPYRVLITTAGRWQGKTDRQRVRAVDFMPGEWILRRAQVLVGIPGIGAIYQALAQGVPIVGAPEHLDQEYHLNRVHALQLGIKLNRRDFKPGKIIAAIECVLADREAYEGRCRDIGQKVDGWGGGETLVDIVDRHFKTKIQHYRLDEAYLVDENEFVRYLELTTPPALDRKSVHQLIQRGEKKGLPFKRGKQHRYFDLLDGWNWLYDREPKFFEADYRALEKKRQHCFRFEPNKVRCKSKWQAYQVSYSLKIYDRDLRPGQRLKLFIPFPIKRLGIQKNIELLDVTPDGFKASLLPQWGVFYGHELVAQNSGQAWELSYTCRLRVAEQGSDVRDKRFSALSDKDRSRYLSVEQALFGRPEVVHFFNQLQLAEKGMDHRQTAQAIYMDLVQHKRFIKTKERTQHPMAYTLAVLKREGGHCRSLSQAFISLCRLQGIPARERYGALLGYPHGEGRLVARSSQETFFGHTWAEIYLEGEGWLPVEFHSIVIGEKAQTPDNVTSPDIKQLIKANGALFRDYYFGHLDHHRLHCDSAAGQLPWCTAEKPNTNADLPPQWAPPEQLHFECHLEADFI